MQMTLSFFGSGPGGARLPGPFGHRENAMPSSAFSNID
jgi:hypothetical protein